MAASPYDIDISRVLDAPRDRVYDAITDPDRFARWYGPDGLPVARGTVEFDPRRLWVTLQSCAVPIALAVTAILVAACKSGGGRGY